MSPGQNLPVDLVSVVIPCHNTERYLAEAIASVLSQSWRPLELIVVDDGSTDRSAEVAARFGGKLTLVRQPHRGAGAARNAGIARARGELLAFLDADDLWTPGSLEARMAPLTADPGLSFVYGRVVEIRSPDLDPSVAVPVREAPMAARVPGATVVRREVVERVGGFPAGEGAGEGLDWMLRIEETGVRSRCVDHVVLRRRIHAGHLGRSRSRREEYLRVVKAALDRRRAGAPPHSVPERRR